MLSLLPVLNHNQGVRHRALRDDCRGEGVELERVYVFFLLIRHFSTSGADDGYKHGLNGYLAGLSFLPNANENSEVLRCLHQCAESLQVIYLCH